MIELIALAFHEKLPLQYQNDGVRGSGKGRYLPVVSYLYYKEKSKMLLMVCFKSNGPARRQCMLFMCWLVAIPDRSADAGHEHADHYPSFMRAEPQGFPEHYSAAMLESRREPRVATWLHKLLRKKGSIQRGHA